MRHAALITYSIRLDVLRFAYTSAAPLGSLVSCITSSVQSPEVLSFSEIMLPLTYTDSIVR